MYRQQKLPKTTLKGIKPYRGETVEKKVARAMSNKEPLKDKAPLIYTDRKDGVNPDHDIRTDKWEYLVEGHDALAKTKRAKRDHVPDVKPDVKPEKGESGAQSTQTT